MLEINQLVQLVMSDTSGQNTDEPKGSPFGGPKIEVQQVLIYKASRTSLFL
jgi:hypothetical protein